MHCPDAAAVSDAGSKQIVVGPVGAVLADAGHHPKGSRRSSRSRHASTGTSTACCDGIGVGVKELHVRVGMRLLAARLELCPCNPAIPNLQVGHLPEQTLELLRIARQVLQGVIIEV